MRVYGYMSYGHASSRVEFDMHSHSSYNSQRS